MLDSIIAAGGSRFPVCIIENDENVQYDLTITEKNLILCKRNFIDEYLNIT